MNLYEAIYVRHSVRTFTRQEPDKNIIDRLKLPVTDRFRIVVIDSKISGNIGSYGMIKDAPAWLALVSDRSGNANLRCAMAAERCVLAMTAQGLGSCWVGATFNSSDTVKKVGLNDGENIAAVIPFGYAASHKRILERITSAFTNSTKRKTFDELFDFDKSTPSAYRKALETVRLAPSAMNVQPWRAKTDRYGNVTFYSSTDNSYTMLDMGIALEHFKIATEQFQIKGKLEIPDSPTPRLIAKWIAANS